MSVFSSRKGFWALMVSQFQVAFSDNAYKFLLTFLMLSAVPDPELQNRYLSLITVLFAVPFLLFSMYGGYLADHFSKRLVVIGIKAVEILIIGIGATALAMGSLPLGLVTLFLLATHSAFYGPSKYGLLPELLPLKDLSWGNGILEMLTFVAIIGGTVAGSWMADTFQGRYLVPGAWLVGLAVVGWGVSWGISPVPAKAPESRFKWNFLADLIQVIRTTRQDRVLFLAVLGAVYFWFLGALLQMNIVHYGTHVLELSKTKVGLLNAAMAIGIGLGSLAAGSLSGHKIEYGLIPLGASGLTVFGGVMAWRGLEGIVPGTLVGPLIGLTLVGWAAGFFIVPVNAIIQHRPPDGEKGRVIAASNLLTFVGVTISAGVYYAMTSTWGFGWDPKTIFGAAAVITLVATVYVIWLLPDSLLRLVLWLATHTIYRIRIVGREHIPEKGGALFICNHMSFVDGLLLMASTDRRIRFIMEASMVDRPVARTLARLMGVIPISSQQGPRELIKSLRTASEAIRSGRVVCIFAEGQITRTGQLLPFRRGFQKIMKDVEAPVIPIHLDGVWGSIFSFEGGKFFFKWPKRIPFPVRVAFGSPLPPRVDPWRVRQAVQELGSEAAQDWVHELIPVHRAFVSTCRKRFRGFAFADFRVSRMRYGTALIKTVALGLLLKSKWKDQEMVGFLLPPSVTGALANFAALLAGKVPVNLNYTASNAILASCAKHCGIKTVITSKAFLEKVKLTVPGEAVFLEDLAGEAGVGTKVMALIAAFCFPVGLIERLLGRKKAASLQDTATIIFSSGSTGDPKGVVLTHLNVASNVKGLHQVFHLTGDDKILGILPFFHSFGFTGTLCLPAYTGIGVVFHPTPLDARVIGGLIRAYQVTFLLATPTFLQLYLRICPPEDFGSLQIVMTGAEKLPERLALSFEDRFGVRPLEGYGCTECAPVVSVNRPDFRSAGFRQVGAKRGSIGHPLPGVAVRIVDLETGEILPPSQSGLLKVKGPNVMAGYYLNEKKTQEVKQEGWYLTGDIAVLDEDGFLKITDRLSRFSKIGGEMVPHGKVEESLHEVMDRTEQTFVVTGVPDEKKGEKLVVLHTLALNEMEGCVEKLGSSGLPNLFIPKAKDFFHIDQIPILGTGKLDLRRVKDLALEFSRIST